MDDLFISFLMLSVRRLLIIMNFTNVAFSYIVQIITIEFLHHRTRNYLCFIDVGENQLPVYN